MVEILSNKKCKKKIFRNLSIPKCDLLFFKSFACYQSNNHSYPI